MREKNLLKREVTDREGNLAAYELYFRNMELGFGLKQAIEKKLAGKENVRVLDIGCGKATALRELKQIFGENIYAIGIDAIKEENPGIDEFIHGSALETVFPGDCDIIVSFRAIHEIGHIKKVAEKVEKALSKNGEAFLSIRCQEFRETRVENLGKINQQDIDFLLEIIEKKKFNSLKVSGKEVPVLMHGVIVDKKTGETRVGALRYIAGVNLFLKKT